MFENLIGESWDIYLIEGRKVGFLRRIISLAKAPNLLVCKSNIVYGDAKFSHEYYFYNEVGYPSHSYLYDLNDGAPLHVRFEDNEMIGQIDDHIFSEIIPANSRPSYGNYPLLITMPFEENHKITFTQIEDTSCTVRGTTQLISHAWESVIVANQRLTLWQIGEYTNGQLGNRYWLDENRRLRFTEWKGAKSFWVKTKEEALRLLPSAFSEYANELENEPREDDWMIDVEDWLHQNRSH